MPFTNDAQQFLQELAANNDKAWFTANKQRFERALQQPSLEFIEEASEWLDAARLPYSGEAKKSGGALSRIYRDTRFSNDKTPYHGHMVIHFTHKNGNKDKLMPVVGLRIDGTGVGLGAGIYGGQTRDLNKVRDAIIKDPEAWAKATHGMQLWGNSLKTAPKGYDKNHQLIDHIRRKQFMVSASLTDAQFKGDLMGAFQRGVQSMEPFLDFLAEALE